MPPKFTPEMKKACEEAVKQVMATMTQKPAASKPKAGKSKRRGRKQRGLGTSEIRFSKEEIVAVVLTSDKGVASGTVGIHPDSAPILKKIASAFERIRWESVQIWWTSATSAMDAGQIAMGIDWDSTPKASPSVQDIAAYAPHIITPLREGTPRTPLRLSQDKLRGRAWYDPHLSNADIIDKQPAALVWSATGKASMTVGQIYMRYTVVLQGPHA